jgi:drug/metabolite transporter (DMT)-like permease
VLACVVCLPFAFPVVGAGTVDWVVVLYLGTVQIGLAYLALSTAMPHVPALEASTLLLVEPGAQPGVAYLVHGERPAPLAWVGGALIVFAALGKTWWDARPSVREGSG